MNASSSEEEASHVGLGGVESVETSSEDAHLPPSVDTGSDNALRDVELGETSVEGKNVLPSVDAESGMTTIEEQSAEVSTEGGESTAADASPTVEVDNPAAPEGELVDSPDISEGKSI
jgi:hypothetical protein